MKVASVRLQNFKRFTDLFIGDIPESSKLVVLMGPNGCGKSSVFDGLVRWHRQKTGLGYSGDNEYYNKGTEGGSVEVSLHGGDNPSRDSLYVRTAYRNDAEFSSSRIESQPSPVDSPAFSRLIEDDKTVSDNYQRLLLDSITALYNQDNKKREAEDICEELVGQIRTSMVNIFGDLSLNGIKEAIGSTAGAGSFYFQKGNVESYHYKNLSGGEKAAFDLILDIHVKKKFFPDAIYCIDEIESHLHTKVQGTILRELVRIVPKASQLWVTTHSLGTLRAAQEIEADDPGAVSLIDFDGVDLDSTCDLHPTTLDRVAWEKMLAITLDDLANRLAPEVIVVCEGSSIGNRRKDFDAKIYNGILGSRRPGVVFVSGGSSLEIASTKRSTESILGSILPSTRVVTLLDRDDRSDEEVSEIEADGGLVLRERNIESYLFADDVINALLIEVGKPELLEQALDIKRTAISASVARGNRNDDFKSAAGDIFNNFRSLLELERPGSDTDAFMRVTLAPLIVPGMNTYEKLKSQIIDVLQ